MTKSLQFLIYSTPQENVKVDVVVKDETVWLTQKAMAALFGVQIPAINKHIKNIYEEGELPENTTISKMEIVVNRGFRGEVNEEVVFFNLDMIIAVGYRVNSKKATDFRIWATQTLKEFITKGFVLDDERLKQGKLAFGKDYFRELLERENTFTMQEFAASINEFLAFRKYQILTDKGKISKLEADKKAEAEYDEFNKTQKIISDFDRVIKKMVEKNSIKVVKLHPCKYLTIKYLQV